MSKQRTDDVLSTAKSFEDLLLSPDLVKSLALSGFESPSPVQMESIPLGKTGSDLIVQAKSGTGKTIVFATICLERLKADIPHPQALILAPTRELAVQSQQVINKLAGELPPPTLTSAVFVGGLPIDEDERKLKRFCHIVVGTPGRILSLIQRGSLVTSSIAIFVLDEVDSLLAENFYTDVTIIYEQLPRRKQVLAFSATYTPELLADLEPLMKRPHRINTAPESVSLLGVKQFHKLVGQTGSPDEEAVFAEKVDALLELLKSVSFHQASVFLNQRGRAEWLCERLAAAGFPAAYLAGDLPQEQRLAAVEAVRAFKTRVIVSTDVMARGVDLTRINLVVSLDLPRDAATLVHRVGRTGRFGSRGIAVTLVNASELETLKRYLEEAQGGTAEPLPDNISSDLYAQELDAGDAQALKSLEEVERPALPPPPPPLWVAKNKEGGAQGGTETIAAVSEQPQTTTAAAEADPNGDAATQAYYNYYYGNYPGYYWYSYPNTARYEASSQPPYYNGNSTPPYTPPYSGYPSANYQASTSPFSGYSPAGPSTAPAYQYSAYDYGYGYPPYRSGSEERSDLNTVPHASMAAGYGNYPATYAYGTAAVGSGMPGTENSAPGRPPTYPTRQAAAGQMAPAQAAATAQELPVVTGRRARSTSGSRASSAQHTVSSFYADGEASVGGFTRNTSLRGNVGTTVLRGDSSGSELGYEHEVSLGGNGDAGDDADDDGEVSSEAPDEEDFDDLPKDEELDAAAVNLISNLIINVQEPPQPPEEPGPESPAAGPPSPQRSGQGVHSPVEHYYPWWQASQDPAQASHAGAEQGPASSWFPPPAPNQPSNPYGQANYDYSGFHDYRWNQPGWQHPIPPGAPPHPQGLQRPYPPQTHPVSPHPHPHLPHPHHHPSHPHRHLTQPHHRPHHSHPHPPHHNGPIPFPSHSHHPSPHPPQPHHSRHCSAHRNHPHSMRGPTYWGSGSWYSDSSCPFCHCSYCQIGPSPNAYYNCYPYPDYGYYGQSRQAYQSEEVCPTCLMRDVATFSVQYQAWHAEYEAWCQQYEQWWAGQQQQQQQQSVAT